MAKRTQAPARYRLRDHGGFDEEWGPHRGISEWWYATGTLTNESGALYSWQFTLLRIRLLGLRPYLLMLAVTDYATGRHRYRQRVTFSKKKVEFGTARLRFGSDAAIEKTGDGMRVAIREDDFSLRLTLGYGKGAVWHCDNGALQMGFDRPRQTTLYYSYPNMPTQGTLELDGGAFAVTGKTWFDKQGGPYSLVNRKTHWEWFSLRFFDDEEVMLFTFPQDHRQDGTYIRKDGSTARLTGYSVEATGFTSVEGLKFACGWSVTLPGIKQERYRIVPLIGGQINLAYFELLAGVENEAGERVGFCFAELLPGVRNKRFPIRAFRNAER